MILITRVYTNIHNIIGLIHSLITSIISCYLLPEYIRNPLGILSEPQLTILKSSIVISLFYFIISTFFIIFIEPYTKKTSQYLIHHTIGITTQSIVLATNQYTNILGACHFMEISTVFLCINSILRHFSIKGLFSNVNDMLFAISFLLCRFTIPYYIFICMII